jgi:hypothetical protein
MTSLCIYFARLTVDEERAICASRVEVEVLRRVLAETEHTPRFQAIRSAFEQKIQRDPFDLTLEYASPTDVMTNRLQQMALFLVIAYFLEEMLGVKPSCVSFYSSGVQPALVYAGCVSIGEYFEHVLPLVRENRVRIEEAGRRLSLVECLLVGKEDDEVETFVRKTIAEMEYAGRVFIKDVRGRHAVLIAGFNDEVVRVRSRVSDAFADVAAKRRRIHQTDGAHIPLYERAPFASLLAWGGVSSPRMPMIGTSGELLPCDDSAPVVSILSDAVSSPMNTHRTLHQVRKFSRFIVIVGSELGARVIQPPNGPRKESPRGCEVKLAIDVLDDNLLDGRFAERGIQV